MHEIHEGDLPYRPVRYVAQAWSVAQVMRVLDLIQSATDTEAPSIHTDGIKLNSSFGAGPLNTLLLSADPPACA